VSTDENVKVLNLNKKFDYKAVVAALIIAIIFNIFSNKNTKEKWYDKWVKSDCTKYKYKPEKYENHKFLKHFILKIKFNTFFV